MTESVSLLTAFLAGVISFISPCVLPIVPGYLSFISGINVAQFKEGATPPGIMRRVLITSLSFVLGFSTVFVALGAAATLIVGGFLLRYKDELAIVGGLLVIVMGVHTVGLVRIPWLLYEKRAELRTRPLSLVGAYAVGLAFAFGWTPCIGPILTGILALAAQRETVAEGVLLLSAYSAGLGIPFLLAALAINAFFRASARIRRHMRVVEVVSGVLLILVGLLLLTGKLSWLARLFSRLFPFLMNVG